jgi:hypothetical protein
VDARLRHLRLVLLDHITSPTALVLPVARIAAEVKARAPGALVVVDGAHCPLQMHLDIARDMPHVDFYTGNLHKWAYTVKGVGGCLPVGGRGRVAAPQLRPPRPPQRWSSLQRPPRQRSQCPNQCPSQSSRPSTSAW